PALIKWISNQYDIFKIGNDVSHYLKTLVLAAVIHQDEFPFIRQLFQLSGKNTDRLFDDGLFIVIRAYNGNFSYFSFFFFYDSWHKINIFLQPGSGIWHSDNKDSIIRINV